MLRYILHYGHGMKRFHTEADALDWAYDNLDCPAHLYHMGEYICTI